jgi:hypothetical protein
VSVERVLAAAAALRRFSLDEIAAFCDEHPPAIVGILETAGPAVERTDLDRDDATGQAHWRVVDRQALRRRMRADTAPTAAVVATPASGFEEQLRYAEETLVRCGAEPSAQRRRVLVATAVNHLRQAMAEDLPGRSEWWKIEISDRLEVEISDRPDTTTAIRLQLHVAVARLAVGNVEGEAVASRDLIDTVIRFRNGAALLGGDERLPGLARGFVDLVTAQLVPTAVSAVDQLVVAVARRRVRAQASSDVDAAMRALEPLVRGLGTDVQRAPVYDLYQMLGHLPDGRDHAVVYADLLPLLPAQFRWQRRGDRLPGALVEVVAEPAVTHHLTPCARTLEADLRHSPFRSDTALIGQAAHVLQELVEQGAGLDGEIRSRGDRTRSELLTLAKAPAWPAPITGPADEKPQ